MLAAVLSLLSGAPAARMAALLQQPQLLQLLLEGGQQQQQPADAAGDSGQAQVNRLADALAMLAAASTTS